MSFQLRRGGLIGGAALGVVAVVATSAALAGAQTADLPIAVAPDSGPPGTSISVSGDGCLGQEVALRLLEGSDTLDLASVPRGPDGDWSGTLTVPDDEDLSGAELTITADCLGGDATYAAGSFSVDEVTPPTTSTTTTTTSTSTSTTTTSTPQGPGTSAPGPAPTTTPPTTTPVTTPTPRPATPVDATPDFAG